MEPPPPDRHFTRADTTNRRLALVALCGGVSLAIYLLLPGLLLPITSSVPSHVAELFPWVKSISTESLSVCKSQSQFDAGLPFFVSCAALFAV